MARQKRMLKSWLMILAAIVCILVLSACSPEATSSPDSDLPDAVIAAKRELSKAQDVPLDEIDHLSFSREEWPDACLGLAESGEMCAQVITPGWRVVLIADGQQYVYRTDASGDLIRLEKE